MGTTYSASYIHITLEPNEQNTDGFALTLYFPQGAEVEDAIACLRVVDRQSILHRNLPLWVDPDDEFFEVLKTELQPFNGVVRFQAHPTC